jgi:uncharacterized protein (DUF302 family)
VEPIFRNGIQSRPSKHSVNETVARIRTTLEAKKVTVFAIVDHSGEALKAGLQMPDTKLIIFGNPAAGTPLMLSAPSTALDLPLKLLVAEDSKAQVWVSWNAPDYLRERHGFSSDLVGNIGVVEKIATEAAS